jgi:hypothetical protein
MSDGAYIVRPVMAFDRDFTRIPNDWVRDENISIGAAGLLTNLMSHAPGYSISIKRLAQRGHEGRTIIERWVAELKEFNYLKHELERGAHGRIVATRWVLTDPAEVARKARSEQQSVLPGLGEAGTRSHRAAVDQHLKEANPQEDLTQELKTGDSTGAGTNEDALTGAAVESPQPHIETPAERYERLIHERCKNSRSGKHDWSAGNYCAWCAAEKPSLAQLVDQS